MTLQQSVLDAILTLEDAVQTRWIHRAIVLCPDEGQCEPASKVLAGMDYMVETIIYDDIRTEEYELSIDRLRNGFSKVLVTTEEVFRIIQEIEDPPLYFDIIV